jgi:hypothetical protein
MISYLLTMFFGQWYTVHERTGRILIFIWGIEAGLEVLLGICGLVLLGRHFIH